jgi:hypothetical protein
MDFRPVALALILTGCAAPADHAHTRPAAQSAAPSGSDTEMVWWGGSAELGALVIAAHGCGFPEVEISYWNFPEENRHMIPGVAIPGRPKDPRSGCVKDWIEAHPEWGFRATG